MSSSEPERDSQEASGPSFPSYKQNLARMIMRKDETAASSPADESSYPQEEHLDSSLSDYVHVVPPEASDAEEENENLEMMSTPAIIVDNSGQDALTIDDDDISAASNIISSSGASSSNATNDANAHDVLEGEGSVVSAMTLSGASSIFCDPNVAADTAAAIPSAIFDKNRNNNNVSSFSNTDVVVEEEKEETAKEKTDTGAFLQAATIAAGAAGLALMLLFPRNKKDKDKDSHKKNRDGKYEVGRASKGNLLFSDW